MQTSCPECGTTFRVSQDQLGLRRGLVRCGSCDAVFNAYDTLLPELESAPPQASLDETAGVQDMGGAPAGTQMAPVHFQVDAEPAAGDGPGALTGVWAEVQSELDLPSDLPDVPPRDALAAYLETAAVQSPVDGDDEMDSVPAEDASLAADPDSADAILLSELPNRQADRTGLPKWKIALYVVLILLLSATLLGQAAFFLRGELAAAIPADSVEDDGTRVDLYRRLRELASLEAVEAFEAEFRDRFGPPPAATEVLLQIARVRVLALASGIDGVAVRGGRVLLQTERGFVKAVDGRLPELGDVPVRQQLDRLVGLLTTYGRSGIIPLPRR